MARMPTHRRQGGAIGHRPQCLCCDPRRRRAANLFAAVNDSPVSMTNVDLSRTNGEETLHVLRKVDFTAESGQLHMLVGPNGCGKVLPATPA